MRFDRARHQRRHLALAVLLAPRLGARQPRPQREHARLQAHGQVAVVGVGAGRDDAHREDRGRVLDAGDDVPACGLEDLDVAVEAAGDEAPPARRERQRRDGLLVVRDDVLRLRGHEVEHGDLVLGGREHGGARGEREHVLDGCRVLEGHDGGARRPGVPQLDRRVVAPRDQHVGHGPRHEAAAADVVGVADEGGRALLARQVPQPHGLVVARAHQGGEVGGRELGRPHGLLVRHPRLQDGARAHVEDLELPRVVAGRDDPAVAPHVAAPRDVAEPRDRLGQLPRPYRVDLHARPRRHGEVVVAGGAAGIGWVGGGHGDVGDGVLRR